MIDKNILCMFDNILKLNFLTFIIISYYREHNQSVCFVPNCKAPKGVSLYNFPYSDQHLLNIWLKRVGLSSLYAMDLYLNIFVCKNHFHENCFDENSADLKPFSIPSINLIGKHFSLNQFYNIKYIL